MISAQRGSGPTAEMAETPPSIKKSALRDFQRIGDPLAWIVGAEDVLNRIALLFAWEASEHRRVRRAWATVSYRPRKPSAYYQLFGFRPILAISRCIGNYFEKPDRLDSSQNIVHLEQPQVG